ncbi:hypothetical protein I317_01528 [Kwoniella heveanensis CBS 569]|nr:hypothetical protein I317_01528 [Kwoniella heveanensis CBS 569]
MSISNPSHLLISRNPPRSPAHPQLAHASTSRHAPSSSPLSSPRPGFLGRWHHSADELTPSSSHPHPQHQHQHHRGGSIPPNLDQQESVAEDESNGKEEEVVDVHSTFLPSFDSPMPGRVKVIVGRNEFWCHKEVLWFASPFFQGLLQGSWAETSGNIHEQAISTTASYSTYAIDQSPEPSIQVPASPPTDTDPPSPRHSSTPAPPESSHGPSDTQQPNHSGHDHRTPWHPYIATRSTSLPSSKAQDDSHDSSSPPSDPTRKGSIYLEALEDDPSVADILRELRGLPETPSETSRSGDDIVEDSGPTLSEVVTGTSSRPRALMLQTSSPEVGEPAALAESSRSPDSMLVSISPETPAQPPLSAVSGVQRRMGRSRTSSTIRHSFSSGTLPVDRGLMESQLGRRPMEAEAVVELHEESASAFHDFLFWAYPHLECKVTWTNVENLLPLSIKLIVPALQKLCEHFLMTHASGRPVMALSLAEEHSNAELFREASRFVLDQPTWDPNEMEALTEQTQLKLSKRRNWFLERLLKLGSIDVKKEYTCRADCPDPLRCQSQLDEKWRQAYSAVCRYGPPQPSVAFRCLRQLETFPTNPSLVMSHPLCQTAAKTWVMSLFDRMFQPKLVFSNPGTEKSVDVEEKDRAQAVISKKTSQLSLLDLD